jgi:hypothetical protein
MRLSNQDTFCTALALTSGENGTASVTTYTDILDFGSHGSDILKKLFLVGICTQALVSAASYASTVAIYWQTSAAEAMSNPVETLLTPSALTDAGLTLNKVVLNNMVLPSGTSLLRYNRLKFVLTPGDNSGTETYPTTVPKFTAFITDNREEPLA